MILIATSLHCSLDKTAVDAVEHISRFDGPRSALTAVSACEIISQSVIAFSGAGDGLRLLRELFGWHKFGLLWHPFAEGRFRL